MRSCAGPSAYSSFGPANGSHAKLCGRGPRGCANSGTAAAALEAPICSRRDAVQVLFGQGGSAAGPKPGRDGFSALLAGYLRDAGSFIAVGLLAP